METNTLWYSTRRTDACKAAAAAIHGWTRPRLHNMVAHKMGDGRFEAASLVYEAKGHNTALIARSSHTSTYGCTYMEKWGDSGAIVLFRRAPALWTSLMGKSLGEEGWLNCGRSTSLLKYPVCGSFDPFRANSWRFSRLNTLFWIKPLARKEHNIQAHSKNSLMQ